MALFRLSHSVSYLRITYRTGMAWKESPLGFQQCHFHLSLFFLLLTRALHGWPRLASTAGREDRRQGSLPCPVLWAEPCWCSMLGLYFTAPLALRADWFCSTQQKGWSGKASCLRLPLAQSQVFLLSQCQAPSPQSPMPCLFLRVPGSSPHL